MKRIFDFTLSFIGLILFLPLIVLITVLIFFCNGRPIFYIKKSLGRRGKVFKVIKFRSMDKGSFKVTKLGRLLRQTALDELLQLVNILKGEMAFVGPRPYNIEKYGLAKDFKGSKIDANQISSGYRDFFKRLEVTPGLTGLAQVFAPKYARDHEVLKWDLNYIERQTIWLDLWLIFVSIGISLKRGWEKTAEKLSSSLKEKLL